MIVESRGNLLAADVEALVNTVNCVGVMGKGLALQFKRTYPANFKAYEVACKAGSVRLGRMFVFRTEAISGPAFIINFPTKGHWKAASRLADIESGLADLVRVVREHGIKSIAIPPLGSGNGGLDWRQVEPLIRSAFQDDPDVTVHLYAPTQVKHDLKASATPMTWGRAVLIRLLRNYVTQRQATEPWADDSGASALEIQKLMYFASLAEPSLRLKFEQGRYGPYSEQVRHLIQGMEGTWLVGFGDGTQKVLDLDPIAPTEDATREADALIARKYPSIDAGLVEPVLELAQGFESAYGLELLATVHWVATHEGAADADAATSAVQKWSERKGRIFTHEHVSRALEQLQHVSVLPESV